MVEITDKKRRGLIQALAAAPLVASAPTLVAAADENILQPVQKTGAAFIERAFVMQRQALDDGDQGYGAVIVRNGIIVGQAPSRVLRRRDPTAHAEMEAIRDAARRLGSRDLGGCRLYSSSKPCPMCEAAAYWAGIERMVYGRSASDGGRPRLCG